MDDKFKIKYHDSLREYYNNDEKRLTHEKADKRARISNSMGYFTGKFISGYIIGYIIGIILAFLFIWYCIVNPLIIPIVKIIFGR